MKTYQKILTVLLVVLTSKVSAQEESKVALNGYKGNYIYNVFKPASVSRPDGDVVGFRLDRKEQREANWQTLYQFSTPSNYNELNNNFEAAKKKVFDFNPAIAYSIEEIWPAFKKTFDYDSIAPYVTQQVVAIAFNILLVDTTAKKGLTYQYKLVQLKKDGTEALNYTSDAVSSNEVLMANRPKKSSRKVNGTVFRMEWKAKMNGKLPEALLIKRSNGINAPFNRLQASYAITQLGDSVIYTVDDDQIRKEELYQYTITPVNRFGGSANIVSDTLSAAILDEQLLRPKIFTAIADTVKNSIILNWSFIKPEFVGAVSVYRSIDYEGNYELLSSTSGYNYIDNTVVAGQKYYYYLVVTDQLARTTERSIKVYGLAYKKQKSDRPVNVVVVAKNNQNTISWTDLNNDTRGFYVYRTGGIDGELRSISAIIYSDKKALGQFSFTDTASNLSGKVGYAVVAENLSNSRSDFSRMVYVQSLTKTALAPTVIDFKNTGSGIYLFWQNLETPKTSVGYNIYRKNGAENYIKVNRIPVSSAKTSYLDNFMLNDVALSYKMTSVNEAGLESEFSNEINVMNAQAVYAPTSLKSFLNTEKKVMLQWQPSQSSVAKYEIYRYVRDAEPVKIATVDAQVLTYTDATFNKEKNNYYFIKTVGVNGKTSLPSSETYMSKQSN